jgi:hypothetical protein
LKGLLNNIALLLFCGLNKIVNKSLAVEIVRCRFFSVDSLEQDSLDERDKDVHV